MRQIFNVTEAFKLRQYFGKSVADGACYQRFSQQISLFTLKPV